VEEHLSVGRLAELAGVTVRTLHHYDEIGLVRPSARTAVGYRVYSAGDVERLREVLAYRRLGFGLREIADLVDDPATDAVAHLRRLRGLLLEQRDRADAMVTAIDRELTARAKGMAVTHQRNSWERSALGCMTRSGVRTLRRGAPIPGSPRRSGMRSATRGRF
jgi:DNA-binding transcriptional MerR regulator